MTDAEVLEFVRMCDSLKPKELFISSLKWKYLIRAIARGKNIMIVGPTGCAKTMAVYSASKALKRPLHRFNIGSTQDARATLVGNTTYKKDQGTVFNQSPFVKAITTPNSIILLDELTRGSHDAWNILMTVLDPLQRYMRLDEDETGSTIDVAPGVCFVSTANIGNEYTATRVLDKATSRRFPIKLEMEPLDGKDLFKLFNILYPKVTPAQKELLKQLADISDDLLIHSKKEDAEISTSISPAAMVEIGELVLDGFTLSEIAEAAIYPEYPDDGGADSERTFVKQILQQYIPVPAKNPINDPLANLPRQNF
jgi:MoxR-like ATPase